MIGKKIDLTNIVSINFDRQFTDDIMMLVIEACNKSTGNSHYGYPERVWKLYEQIKNNNFQKPADPFFHTYFRGNSGKIALISLLVLVYFAERIEPSIDCSEIKLRLNRTLQHNSVEYFEIKNRLLNELDVMIDVPAKEPDTQKTLSMIDEVKKEIEELRTWGKRHEQRADFYQSEAQAIADELASLKETNKKLAEENLNLKRQNAQNAPVHVATPNVDIEAIKKETQLAELQRIVEAAKEMLRWEDAKPIFDLLNEAYQGYPKNYFAIINQIKNHFKNEAKKSKETVATGTNQGIMANTVTIEMKKDDVQKLI